MLYALNFLNSINATATKTKPITITPAEIAFSPVWGNVLFDPCFSDLLELLVDELFPAGTTTPFFSVLVDSNFVVVSFEDWLTN